MIPEAHLFRGALSFKEAWMDAMLFLLCTQCASLFISGMVLGLLIRMRRLFV